MTKDLLIEKINFLKKAKNIVILAHYYQENDIQDIADFVGDSLALSQQAKSTNADIIAFSGVHFMAETAKILNPRKKVILPDLNAGCSLADACQPEDLKKFKEKHPQHKVVSYINCSAEIKALSDMIVTSSNAKKIIDSFPKDEKIIFAPDKNLGNYLNNITGRQMILWDGVCMVHEAFSLEKVLEQIKKYPNAKLIAHPESSPQILKVASFVGSTLALLNYIQKDESEQFIIATEKGIFHQMKKNAPKKTLIQAGTFDDHSCQCGECSYMRMNNLEKLLACMESETPEIILNNTLLDKAATPMERMLELS